MTIIEDEADELEQDDGPDTLPEDAIRCPECPEVFTGLARNLALGRHRKAHHREEWEASRSSQSAPSPRRTATRASSGSKTKPDRAPRGPSVSREVAQNVQLFYGVVADLWTFRGDPCGPVLKQSVPTIANAWGELAKANPAVAKFWAGGGGAASWLGVGMAHMPVVMALYQTKVLPRRLARQQAEADMMGDGDFGPEPETVVYTPGGAVFYPPSGADGGETYSEGALG